MKTNLFRKNHSSSKGGMRMMHLALLLLPLLGRGLGGDCVLFAQNGVTVSDLEVSAGTVTFNVSWDRDAMPVALWSDTVWVFVDYNNAGKMERLPLSPGATLTATSPDGKVIEEIDNNKGVWIAGNARTQGSFSATVKLLTATANLAGACAYASNYPPVGEYLSATEISFTGTPEYEIVLKDNGGGTITRESGSLFSVPASYTVQSFSDKTGAPGIVKCIVPANPAVIGASRSCSGMVTLSASSPGAIIEWYADVAATSTLHIGANYTTPEIETSTTYYVQARVGDCLSARVPVLAVITAGCCTAPGATGITFAKFNPCAGYPYGSTYTLIDDRDQKTYKVKYMPDGRYWMVQDLMFGNCTESSWKNDDSEAATKVEPTVAPDYMGHCRSTTVSGVGYFYNWPAAMNNSKAFYSSTTTDFDCSGTGASANACQGICPTGWHLPTGKTDGEIYTLHTALVVYTSCTDRKCWENPAMPEVLPGGYVAPDGTFWCITGWRYYTSTAYDRYTTYEHQACSLFWAGDKTANVDRRWGFNVRCVRNY